jgi:hypothetical protein
LHSKSTQSNRLNIRHDLQDQICSNVCSRLEIVDFCSNFFHFNSRVDFALGEWCECSGQSSINAGIYGEFGADYHASEQVSLNAHYKTANYGGVNIGVGYRF